MSGQTPLYGMAFFDFRDRLDLGINVRKEIDRFLLIDKQLYGLYSIFGDGIISGWGLSEPARDSQQQTIRVAIDPGVGIINAIAVDTSLPVILQDLPTNDTFDIYAVLVGQSVTTRDVQFVWSRVAPGSHAVRLARVTTGSNSVTTIDSSYRDEIGFLELIQSEIAKHKHRGSPSKIDLRQETRNQLPGARVADFDASKIVGGRFDIDRIPQIDHNNLANNGLLTHAGLDSMVRNIVSGNRQLLGEIGIANLMKLVLAWMYVNSTADAGFLNTLAIIPGITSNSLIDFDASTAYIDLVSQCISGKPNNAGQVRSVIWETTSAFSSASDRNLVSIAKNTVSLTRGANSATYVENFEQVPSGGVKIPGFTAETSIIDDKLEVISDPNDGFRTEGFYSGKFQTQRNFRALYRKQITTGNDWSIFDELVLDVKSLAITHGAVYMYFVNGSGDDATQSQTYLLLGPDEITSNPDRTLNGFERRSFSILNEERANVTELVIYTDDIVSKQVFWIDNIFLRNQALYPPTGYIRFRYSGGVNVNFRSLIYDAVVPDGCDLRVRIRTANSTSLLDRAVFTAPLNSGDLLSLEGTDAEIDIAFFANAQRNKTPVLSLLELQLQVDSNEVGFTIDSSNEWDRGSYVNTSLKLDESRLTTKIVLADPVPVGDIYYSFKNVVSEIDPLLVAITGFQGAKFLLSPNQALNYVINQGARGFKFPFSVYRLESRNFLIADLDNDRVIEVEQDGTFVRGVGSHNVADASFFFPLTAVYNPRTGILSTTFSQEVESADLDIRKIVLWIGGSPIALGSADIVQESTKTKQILEIELSADKQEQMFNTSSIVTVQYLSGAFPKTFSYSQSAQQLIGTQGMEVFIGDFVFIDGISRPVFANLLENGNWMIANSSIAFDQKTSGGGTVARYEVKVGENKSFVVQVDPPNNGFFVNWRIVVPSELTSIVSYSTPPPGNVTTVNVTSPTSAVVGEWTIVFIAEYRDIQTQEVISSTQNQAVLAIVESTDSSTDGDSPASSPDVMEVELDSATVVFSFDKIHFSDYSLGSVYEVDEDTLLIAGITKIEDSLLTAQPPTADETFAQEAARKLVNYRGKVMLVDRATSAIRFQYDSPDGSYASDAVLDDENNYVIAESTFASNSGRVVRLDSFGNIVAQLSGGVFSKINDVRALINGNILIST